MVEDLRRANRSAGGTRQAGLGSNTASDIALGEKHGAGHPEGVTFGQVIGAEILSKGLEHAGGAVVGHGIFGTLTHGAGLAGTLIANYFRRAGLRGRDDLVSAAMLDPTIARGLVMKVSTPAAKERAAVILNRALNRQAVPILLHGTDRGNGERNG